MTRPADARLIGVFTNKWRGRRVEIFEDPADPTMVYTVGAPLDGRGAPVETREPRERFARYIGSFHKVYE